MPLVYRASIIWSDSARSAWWRSQRSCRFTQKPGEVPKNLDSRKAVLGVTPRRPRTTSLTRWYGTRIALAKACCVMPVGRRNSLRSHILCLESLAPMVGGSRQSGTDLC